jgi:hypothetical protein
MIVYAKKEFSIGVVMTLSFLVVLAIMFSSIFGGKNAFEAADAFFNSIAKGSTYYMPDVLKQSEVWKGKTFEVSIKLGDKEIADKATKLFGATGAKVSADGAQLTVAGDLGKVSVAAVQDADAMFHNRGKEVADRYGFPEKEVLFVWWTAFKEVGKDLKRQKKFEEADRLGEVSQRAVEVGYNFYGIHAEKASSSAGMLTVSMLFYILYTLWWGYAILFLFEGLGLEMKPGAKKEM